MKANEKKTKSKVMVTVAAASENKMNMHNKHYIEIIIFILINCFGISGCAEQITMSFFARKPFPGNRQILYYVQINSQLLFLIKHTYTTRKTTEEKNALLNGHIYVMAPPPPRYDFQSSLKSKMNHFILLFLKRNQIIHEHQAQHLNFQFK